MDIELSNVITQAAKRYFGSDNLRINEYVIYLRNSDLSRKDIRGIGTAMIEEIETEINRLGSIKEKFENLKNRYEASLLKKEN